MTLNDTLTIDNIICDATEITSKKQVLEHIGHIACRCSEALNYVEVLQALIKRERLGSTALGHGVAVPHARVEHIDTPIVCLITTHTAINFYEDETVAVDIIFGILAPVNANDQQLGILADIAKRLQHKSYRDGLRQAVSPTELLAAALSQPNQETDHAQKDTDHQQ